MNLIYPLIEDNIHSLHNITFIRKKGGQTGRQSIQSHICSHTDTYLWRPQSQDRRAGITKHHSQSNIWPCYLEINPCVKYACALTRYMHKRETQMTFTMFYSPYSNLLFHRHACVVIKSCHTHATSLDPLRITWRITTVCITVHPIQELKNTRIYKILCTIFIQYSICCLPRQSYLKGQFTKR